MPHTIQILPVIARRYDLWGDYYATLGNCYDEAILNINKGYKVKKKYCTSKQLIYERQKCQLKKINLMVACRKNNRVRFICEKALLTSRYYNVIHKIDLRKSVAEYRYYLACSLFNKNNPKNYDLVKKHLSIANKLCLELQKEGQKTSNLLSMIYEMLGMVFEVNKDYSMANENYTAAYEYSKKSMAISAEACLTLQHIQICKSLAIICLYKKNNVGFEKYLNEINDYCNILDSCAFNSLSFYNGLAEFWYLKGLYTKDDQMINKSMQLYKGLQGSSSKNRNRAWINNPTKRFGIDIVDLFSCM